MKITLGNNKCPMTFYEYLEEIRPLISSMSLEKAAGIPARTMYRHFAGLQPLPEKHIPAIVRAISARFGAVIVGEWTIWADPEGPAFFAKRSIPGREVECKEVAEGGASHFEYLAPEYREVFDEIGLIGFLKEQ